MGRKRKSAAESKERAADENVGTKNKRRKQSNGGRAKPKVVYTAHFEDIDYHNAPDGSEVDSGVIGAYEDRKDAEKAVRSHFSGWDDTFWEEMEETHDGGELQIEAWCPEGELMKAWVTEDVLEVLGTVFWKVLGTVRKESHELRTLTMKNSGVVQIETTEPKRKSKAARKKMKTVFVAQYEDIDYHNDWSGQSRDIGVIGTYDNLDDANKAARGHFSGWDDDFWEDMDETKGKDGEIKIKASCPEGEIMKAWVTRKQV